MKTLKSRIVFLLTLSFLFSAYAQDAQFVSGKKILFEEKFSKDIVGDFPVNWFTNSSGEITNISSNKWLQLSDKGSFSPLNVSKLPENFTFEFDVTTTDNFNFYSTPLNVVFTEKKSKADDVWNTTLKRKEAIVFNVHPANSLSGTGRSEIFVISEKKEIIKNKVDVPVFNKNKNTVRVQIWRQKNRFRMFIDGKSFGICHQHLKKQITTRLSFLLELIKNPLTNYLFPI
jgi:OOP family OmpA-OmpF porin